jgi:uncharacterized protein YecE (DUF72 family)
LAKSYTANSAIKDDLGFSGERFRVGCAGWNIPRQSSNSFASEGSHLERYSQTFNCCEINSSFYRPHKKETWERWAASVPAGFQFSGKVPKAITHEVKLNCGTEVLSAFLQQIKLLREKLGSILIQLPPSLVFDSSSAKKFLSLLRQEYSGDVVCEPRHGSWFCDRVDDVLQEYRVARVAADPACVPNAMRPGGSLSLVYFRLHGSPRRFYSAYNDDFLTKLSVELENLKTSARVWCIFDNTASGNAAQNALESNTKLNKSR